MSEQLSLASLLRLAIEHQPGIRPIHSVTHFFPAFACSYTTAILVQLPRTYLLRIALLPLTLILFLRAIRVEWASNAGDYILRYADHWFTMLLITFSLRAVIWTFQRKPYKRISSHKMESHPSDCPPTQKDIFRNAFDLLFDARGYGWNWSQRPFVPTERRPINNRAAFLRVVAKSTLLDWIICDQIYYSIRLLTPAMTEHPGCSVFEPSCGSFIGRQTIVYLIPFSAIFSIQFFHDVASILGVGLFRQDPSRWPPLFDAPWRSTSISEYWGRRWHQIFREQFTYFGAMPMSAIFGRAGGVLGAFMISSLLHDLALRGAGYNSNFVHIMICFIMNGVGIILESAWRKLTGYRVQGWLGRIWTTGWIYIWGHFLVDAWISSGFLTGLTIPTLHPSLYTTPSSTWFCAFGMSPEWSHLLAALISLAKVVIFIRLHPMSYTTS